MTLLDPRPGESFGRYFTRLTEDQAVRLAVLAKRFDVTPQQLYASYLVPALEPDDGRGVT